MSNPDSNGSWNDAGHEHRDQGQQNPSDASAPAEPWAQPQSPAPAPSGQDPHAQPGPSQPEPWAVQGQDVPAADPYGQASASDSYGHPSTSDPYGQTSASDPYGQSAAQPSAADPFGQPSPQDPFGQPPAADPYGHSAQQPFAADPLAQSAASPYGQPQQAGYGAAPAFAQQNPGGVGQSRLLVGLLGIFVGGFGVHRFLMGYTTIGIIQIVVTLVTCGFGAIWGLVEGIMVLAKAQGFERDAHGRPLAD